MMDGLVRPARPRQKRPNVWPLFATKYQVAAICSRRGVGTNRNLCSRKPFHVHTSIGAQIVDIQKKRQIQITLRQLAEAHAKTVATCLADALQVLGALPNIADLAADEQPRTSRQIADSSSSRLIDQPMLSVVYRGKRCFLGNTLPFRLIERLASQPNRYFSNDQLLEEVWHDLVSKEAIRSVVKVLRAKLRQAGMNAIAAVIDGTVRGHYALMLDRL